MNVPVDELHAECLEARALIRRLHGEARHRLGLDCPAADVLEAAADLIEKHGRFRGHRTERSKHCPGTAIEQVVHGGDGSVARMALRDAIGGPKASILLWNDNEPDDAIVLNTMRSVAQRLREVGE